MKVYEALQFRADLEQSLAVEQDPAIRGWYETETKLGADYQETERAVEALGDFATGLQTLIDVKNQLVAAPEPLVVDLDGFISEADIIEEHEEFETYVSPEERKRRSVTAWMDSAIAEYAADVAEAHKIPKASKQQKRLKMADRSFRRKFEYFGTDKTHIVYDVDALGVAVEELTDKSPELLESLAVSVEDYIAGHREEFYDRPDILAKLFVLGMADVDDGGKPTDSIYARAFSALGKESINGTDLVDFRYAIARTALELVAFKNNHLLESIVSLADFLPRNEDDRKGKAGMLQLEMFDAYRRGDMAAIVKMIETGAVISQIRIQLLGFQERTAPMGVELSKHDLELLMAKYTRTNPLTSSEEKNIADWIARMGNYAQGPLYFDSVELISVPEEELVDISREEPEEALQSTRLQEPLFKRRMEVLAPLSYTHEISRNALDGFSEGVYFDSVHTAISPSLAVSTYIKSGPESPEYANQIHNSLYNAMLQTGIGTEVPVLYDSDTTKLGFRLMEFKDIPIESEGETHYHDAAVILRPLVEADRRTEHPVHQLTLPLLRFFQEQPEGAAHELITRSETVKKNILEKGTRFVGRRPIHFNMPPELRTQGVLSINVRRHEDGKRTVAQFELVEGTVELEYDQALEILDNRELPLHGDSYLYHSQAAAASAILLPLLEEWACREVAETSEGSVSLEETGRVNMGHFAYLGFKKDGSKKNHSPDQAAVCQREQGRNLAVESLRRQAMDPSGKARNSTYVRENYDPRKPALEVHYDPAILGL